jgi:hypothetical protein
MQKGIIGMRMALNTCHRRALPYLPRCPHAVNNCGDAKFFILRSSLVIIHRIAVKGGCNKLVIRRVWKQVAGQLFDGKLIERHVAVKSPDYPIAVTPNGSARIAFIPFGIGIPGHIEPPRSPLFAKVRRGEQMINHAFISVSPFIF